MGYAKPTPRRPPANTVFTMSELCRPCGGKVSFQTKEGAKRARKETRSQGRLTVYRCPVEPSLYHLGHLPVAVRRGQVGREEIYVAGPPFNVDIARGPAVVDTGSAAAAADPGLTAATGVEIT